MVESIEREEWRDKGEESGREEGEGCNVGKEWGMGEIVGVSGLVYLCI